VRPTAAATALDRLNARTTAAGLRPAAAMAATLRSLDSSLALVVTAVAATRLRGRRSRNRQSGDAGGEE
jgi:hypothetical protein